MHFFSLPLNPLASSFSRLGFFGWRTNRCCLSFASGAGKAARSLAEVSKAQARSLSYLFLLGLINGSAAKQNCKKKKAQEIEKYASDFVLSFLFFFPSFLSSLHWLLFSLFFCFTPSYPLPRALFWGGCVVAIFACLIFFFFVLCFLYGSVIYIIFF